MRWTSHYARHPCGFEARRDQDESHTRLAAADILFLDAKRGAAAAGLTLTATDEATIDQTLHLGVNQPDGTGNWSCSANDDCILRTPVDRIIGQPDVVDVVPFESFTEFTNPSLLVFFILVNADSPIAPINSICNRQPVAFPVKNIDYNRLYASVNVRGLSCKDHDPALFEKSCTTNGDCDSPANICAGGRCDVPVTTTCKSNSECMPWEFCIPPSKNCTSCFSGCSTIGSCDPRDPFAVGVCPKVTDFGIPVATYCNGGECRRE